MIILHLSLKAFFVFHKSILGQESGQLDCSENEQEIGYSPSLVHILWAILEDLNDLC
jgi:hypothetical protein